MRVSLIKKGEDCGHDSWDIVDQHIGHDTEVYWDVCRVCGLRRTVSISMYRVEDSVSYWWPSL